MSLFAHTPISIFSLLHFPGYQRLLFLLNSMDINRFISTPLEDHYPNSLQKFEDSQTTTNVKSPNCISVK